MTTPSPFEIGRGVGNNVGNAIQGSRDRSAIDEILEEANASKDPGAVDNAIRQILAQVSPRNQPTALKVLQNKQENIVGNRIQQQQRLQLDSIQKRYNSRIKEINEELKTVRYDKRSALESKRKALQKERDSLLGLSTEEEEIAKPVFDVSNVEHKARRDQILRDVKGDRKKAQEILEKEFSL